MIVRIFAPRPYSPGVAPVILIFSQAEGERQDSHFEDSEKIKEAVRRTLDTFTLERLRRVVHELGVALQGH